ncbi:MAG: beta-N-acetylhexosaminidase [Candidatus Omnitrophica bacterium]|nr:beta-N-acetylhexosaminidase [Candidatus Omnitrophota bacterium]
MMPGIAAALRRVRGAGGRRNSVDRAAVPVLRGSAFHAARFEMPRGGICPVWLRLNIQSAGIVAVAVLSAFGVLPVSDGAAAAVSIVPAPQQLTQYDYTVTLDTTWRILVSAGDPDAVFAAQQLRGYLHDQLEIVATSYMFTGNRERCIVLDSAAGGLSGRAPSAETLARLGRQGYLLEVFPAAIVITAQAAPGIFYGVQSLRQLLRASRPASWSVPGLRIVDYPSLPLRGIHLLGLSGTLQEMRKKIDFLSHLKINAAIISEDSFWELEKDTLVPGTRNKFVLQELFAYARQRHIEPISELQSFGIAVALLRKDPHAGEGVWIRDEPFVWRDDFAVPQRAADIPLKNAGFELAGRGCFPSGWQVRGKPGQADWRRDTSTARSGHSSMTLSVSAPFARPSKELCFPDIAVEPEALYQLRCYAKKKTVAVGADRDFAVRVSQIDAAGNVLAAHYLPLQYAQDSWSALDLNFQTLPAAVSVQISAACTQGSGTVWLDDFSLRCLDGALINVVRTEASDICVTDQNKTVVYEEGRDYRVLNGELRHAYGVSHNRPTRVMRLPQGRIDPGQVVLISYDCIVPFHPAEWMTPYCPSEPRTYAVFSGVLRDVIGALRPRYVSIGHDDIFGMCRDSRCRKRNLSPAALLAEDVQGLVSCVRQIDPAVRVMMWDDMLNPWHTGGVPDFQVSYSGAPGATGGALDLVPPDVILLSWWYDAQDLQKKMEKTPALYAAKSFEYLGAGWKEESLQLWARKVEGQPACRGLLVTTWDGWDNNNAGIRALAEHGWSAR